MKMIIIVPHTKRLLVLTCVITGMFKISSTKELSEIKDIEKAREICKACPYSDLEGGLDEWDGYLD